MTDVLPSNKPSSSGEGLPSKFKSKLLECFGYTTAHGCGRVADAVDARPRRWFWLLACAAAYGVFAYQLHELTLQFLSKPLKTRAWIAHEQRLSFPQVTVCNLNKIRKSRIPEDVLKDFPQILGGHGENKSTPSTNVNNQSLMNDEDLPHGNILKERVEKRLAGYSDSVLKAAGHQLEDMILKCVYDSMECLDGMRQLWTHFWHPKYGNCYTFNRGRNNNGTQTRLMTSSIPGHDAGLKLEINLEQYEYVSELTDEAGLRVFIGTQNLMPFPYELGISVAPAYSTAIMLRKVVIGRLDPFANRSCEPKSTLLEHNVFQRYNVSYSDLACKISCLAISMNEMCGCIYYTLKYYEHHEVCDGSDLSTVDCINAAYDKYSDGVCEKDCREKCREESFKMTVSVAEWPSQHYKSTLQTKVKEDGLGNHSTDLNVNFLKLKVYYGELNFEVIDEERAYPFTRFLSDIGGIMGMWIGISALTCVEVLELIFLLSFTVLRKIKGTRDNVIEVQPYDSPA